MDQYNQLICGFIQGFTRVMLIYPFDAAKLNMQTKKYTSYKNWYKCKNRRWIYSGVQLPLMVSSIEKACSMTLYEDLNKLFGSYIFSAFCVSLISCTINVPIQVIVNNYILNKNESFIGNIKNIWNNRSIYRGFCIEAPRFFVSYTIYMGLYGNIRSLYEPNLLYTAINGYICNITISYGFYAFDIVKNIQQVENSKALQVAVSIKKYGISEFFRGSKIILVRSFFSGSVTMVIYELLRQKLGLNKKK
jgi:hypothetical protein